MISERREQGEIFGKTIQLKSLILDSEENINET